MSDNTVFATSMKLLNCALVWVFALGTALSGATVVNDGTTVDGLVRRAPEPVFPPATTTLAPTGDGHLLVGVDQPNSLNFPALHSAWFSEVYAATGSTHQVSAAFRLSESLPADSGGGVLGWFDEATWLGVTFALKTAATPYVGLEIYNLDTGARPRDWLYDLGGVEVHPDFTQAWRSSLGGNFRDTNFLVLRLSFAAPSTEDLEVLTNATARIAAEALQDNGQRLQTVAPRLEFLTTLPEPLSGEKRFGYYAVYAALGPRTGPIGHLDNLTIEGDFGMGNRRPLVSLLQPVPGAVFAPGALIELVAEASDPDPGDRVVQVDFYAGAALIGSATEEPFSVRWSSDALGMYELTAIATDTRGANRVSEGVQIEVAEVLTEPPVLTVHREGSLIVLSWDRTGAQLQASSDLGGSWVEVPTSGTQHSEAITGTLKLFRLVGSGLPSGPTLSMSTADGMLTITWTQAGYQLQSSVDPVSGWATIPTVSNQHTETMDGPRKFFRLIQ